MLKVRVIIFCIAPRSNPAMTRPLSTPRQPWWAVAVPQVNERTGRARLATDRWASSAHAVPEWPTFGGVAKPIAIVRAARGVACTRATTAGIEERSSTWSSRGARVAGFLKRGPLCRCSSWCTWPPVAASRVIGCPN